MCAAKPVAARLRAEVMSQRLYACGPESVNDAKVVVTSAFFALDAPSAASRIGSVVGAARAELDVGLFDGDVGLEAGAVMRLAVGCEVAGVGQPETATLGQLAPASARRRARACARRRASARLLPSSAAAKSSAAPDVPVVTSSSTGSSIAPSPAAAAIVSRGLGLVARPP